MRLIIQDVEQLSQLIQILDAWFMPEDCGERKSKQHVHEADAEFQ